jgi:hypothetical protein
MIRREEEETRKKKSGNHLFRADKKEQTKHIKKNLGYVQSTHITVSPILRYQLGIKILNSVY